MHNEGERLSPYSPCQPLASFIGDSTSHNSKATTNLVLRFVVIMCYCDILFLPHLNTLNMWDSTPRAQRPLTTSVVKRQFPSLRDIPWRNNGVCETALASSTIFAFYAENTNIHGVKCKLLWCNRVWDRSVGFCCHSALGFVRTVRPILQPKGPRIRRPVSRAPPCIVITNLSWMADQLNYRCNKGMGEWLCLITL